MQTSPIAAPPPWRGVAARLAPFADLRRLRPMLLAVPLVAMLGLMVVVTSYEEAVAQQRTTCSRARDACGKQRICQARFRDCLETGCWTVWKLRRCGYQKR